MKNHRMITLAGAGSALAATIAFAALLFVPSSGTTVEAATIFASFRDAVTNAFTISLEDIGDEGIRVSGEASIVFKEGISTGVNSSDEIHGIHVDLHIKADEDAKEVAGLEIKLNAAFTEDSQWVYFKTKGLPHKLLQEEPMVAVIQAMSANGLLLELTGLMDELDPGGGGFATLSDLGITTGASASASASGDVKTGLEVELRRQGVSPEEAAEAVEAAVAITHGANLEPQATDSEEFEALAGDLLTGKATADDLRQLATMIEEAASDVSVTPQEDGSYLLTAWGFDIDDESMDADEQAMIERMELEIAYKEATGVLWARLLHIGAYDGTLRFEATAISADDPMFSSQRYREDGVTTFLDLSAFKGLIEGIDGL